jgi:prevent-host-death family protein
MYTVGASEAKTHFSALLERVISGEKILITKHGQIIAKIIPMTGIDKEVTEDAIQSILAFQNSHVLGLDWKELRDEGRK